MPAKKKPTAATLKTDIDHSIRFARTHIIMVSLLLVFFGVLTVPYTIKKIKYSLYKKTEGTVVNIYYTQSNPSLTIADIQYESGGKTIIFRETLHKSVKKNDVVVFYTHRRTNDVSFDHPRLYIYLILLIVYFLILIYCVYLAWYLYFYV
jgi:hypothetical protein